MTKTLVERGAARALAWGTRRAKYGPRGHGGSYDCGHRVCLRCADMEALIVKLYREEVLSEGQAAKATGLDRVTLRIKAEQQDPSFGPAAMISAALKEGGE